MPDTRFFGEAVKTALGQLAPHCGASLFNEAADAGFIVSGVAPLDTAGPDDLSFLDNPKYREQFKTTKAGACIVHPDMAALAPGGVRLLVSPNPYKSYALAAQILYPEPAPAPYVSDRAFIDSSASIGEDCVIEPGVVIGAHAEIGSFCRIEANAVIGAGVKLGDHCRVGPNANISHALIGSHVRMYPGVRIGQDGFGFAIDPKGHVKVPQLGRVVIGDRVEIGANTCIDRGAGPDTIIGTGTWIDNLVQIGHNVQIGRGCIIVSQAGISGSTIIEDYVVLAGQVGVAGHLRIGKGARIAAKSGIMRDVPAGEEQMGYPALPIRQFMRQIATINQMASPKSRSGKS